MSDLDQTLDRLAPRLRGALIQPGDGTEPGEDDRIGDWARGYWDDLDPHSAGGACVNFMGDEGDARVRAAYRGNYDRLVEVKTRWDPDNLFRRNQNIPPRR